MEKTNNFLPHGFKKSICSNCKKCKPYFIDNCRILQNSFNFVREFGIEIIIVECKEYDEQSDTPK